MNFRIQGIMMMLAAIVTNAGEKPWFNRNKGTMTVVIAKEIPCVK